MEAYQQSFVEFMVRAGLLRFGDFVTKSGRETPFFINTGQCADGASMAQLGEFYARALLDELGEDGFDVLFGPAYKGIPLVVATSMALARLTGRPAPFAFDRKEAKDHGEGGILVGTPLAEGQRVVIVDDVVTNGEAKREAAAKLRAAAGVELTALIVSVDREERGKTDKSALAELRADLGTRTISIVTISDAVAYLKGRELDGKIIIDDARMAQIEAYRAQYAAVN